MMTPTPIITSDGERYPSQKAFASAAGIVAPVVSYHLNTHGNLDRAGRGQSRPGCQNAAKPTRLGAQEWPSRVAAARDLGMPASTLSHMLKQQHQPAYQEKLFAALISFERRRRHG